MILIDVNLLISAVFMGSTHRDVVCSDVHQAALAAKHGCLLASTDDDFQKFPGLRWFNPLASGQLRV